MHDRKADRLTNISLIGMPGAGKTTSGQHLASQQGLQFIDTDILITESTGRTLQDIVDHEGPMSLREIEENVILGVDVQHSVIATGGSAVYSARAMRHLSAISHIIYLYVPYDVIEDRISNLDTRGLARHPEQSLYDLFLERSALYEKYAEFTVEATLPAEEVARNIAQEISRKYSL
jgi:shikimate kinase